MNKIEFLVQGSAQIPYAVRLVQKDCNNIAITCTCPAGEMGQVCKHRLRILGGNDEGIVSANKADITIIKIWLQATDVESAVEVVINSERLLEEAKKNLSLAKKKLVALMRE